MYATSTQGARVRYTGTRVRESSIVSSKSAHTYDIVAVYIHNTLYLVC